MDAKNRHGDNRELVELLRRKGKGYEDNFQFSILEVADPQLLGSEIQDRENYWKQILCSRTRGYNAN